MALVARLLRGNLQDVSSVIHGCHQKNDLDLGSRLALRFADQHLPEKAADKVYDIFRRKGAYARFKDLLESLGIL